MHVSVLSRTVLEGFDRAAARAPHDVAATCGDRSMTYQELDTRANGIAWRLHERGVGPESVVGICLPRGLDMATAVLGVLKAGAGYLPAEVTRSRWIGCGDLYDPPPNDPVVAAFRDKVDAALLDYLAQTGRL